MKYKFKRVKEFGYIIIEDGHTMFPEDVIQRFKRLEYLEKEYFELFKQLIIKRFCECGNPITVENESKCYSCWSMEKEN